MRPFSSQKGLTVHKNTCFEEPGQQDVADEEEQEEKVDAYQGSSDEEEEKEDDQGSSGVGGEVGGSEEDDWGGLGGAGYADDDNSLFSSSASQDSRDSDLRSLLEQMSTQDEDPQCEMSPMDISGLPIDVSMLLEEDVAGPIPANMVKAVDLLFELRRSNVPLACYDRIRKWTQTHFEVLLPTQDSVIKYFMKRHDLEELWPRTKACHLPSKQRNVPLVYHSAEAAIKSLLTNPVLMQPENLNIDSTNPHKPPDVSDFINEVTSGSVYQMGWKEYCHDDPNKVPCFLITFIDKSPLDMHGHISLFPVPFMLSIFKEHVRRRPEAWATLFYIRNTKTEVVDSEAGLDGLDADPIAPLPDINPNLQDLHSMLKKGFEEIESIQRDGGLQFELGGRMYFLQIPLLLILGDAQGNDQLCCLKGGGFRGDGTGNPQCCICACPYPRTGDPYGAFELTHMGRIKRWLERGNTAAVKSLGYHPLTRNAFFDIPFCDKEGGVNACTPAGLLHQLQHGVIEYACYGFFELTRTTSDQRIFTPNTMPVVNGKMRRIGQSLQHQSDRSLGKTYFRSGYIPEVTKGKRASMKRGGQEISGMVLVYLLFLLTNEAESRSILDLTDGGKLVQYIHLFERLLLLLEFIQQTEIAKLSVGRLHAYMPALFQYFIETIQRTEGAGNDVKKFHYLLHIALDLIRFGVALNILEGVGERNFKVHKGNARQTQKRQHTIDLQCAVRDIEGKILDRAYAEIMHERTSEWRFFWGDDGQPSSPEPANGPGGPLLKVRFKWDDLLHKVTAILKPARFKREDLNTKWTSTDITLPTLRAFLEDKVAPSLIQDNYTCAMVTGYQHNGVRYKGNPLYEYTGAWHDWAYFQTEEIGKTLCHILAIFTISGTKDGATCDAMLSSNNFIRDGTYALCHYFPEDPFGPERQCSIYGNTGEDYLVNSNCTIIRWCCKVTNRIAGPRVPQRLPVPIMALVSLDDIIGPAIVIPDLDQNYPHKYWCIATRAEWPTFFSTYMAETINDVEAQDALEELEEMARDIDLVGFLRGAEEEAKVEET